MICQYGFREWSVGSDTYEKLKDRGQLTQVFHRSPNAGNEQLNNFGMMIPKGEVHGAKVPRQQAMYTSAASIKNK